MSGDEAIAADDATRRIRRTQAGAISIRTDLAQTTVVYERPGADHHRRVHGIVVCLAAAEAAGQRRSGITNLGADLQALAPEQEDAVLFDLGLRCSNLDACIRTADRDLIGMLDERAGTPLLDAGPELMTALLARSPTRVFDTAIARIEVYQAIAPEGGKTPPGPHTHVLPNLLKTGRTHFNYVPVPPSTLPVLECYPGPRLQRTLAVAGTRTDSDRES